MYLQVRFINILESEYIVLESEVPENHRPIDSTGHHTTDHVPQNDHGICSA